MRTPGSSRETTWPVIRRVGVDLLYERGFERVTLRQLADAANLQKGSLYNYFETKQEFLFRIVCELIEEIVGDIDRSLDGLDDPIDRLIAFVRVLVDWHTKRNRETFIAAMDVRSLGDDGFQHYRKLRGTFDRTLNGIIEDGCEAGQMSVPDVSLATNAVMSLITNICHWYRPNGRRSAAEISSSYVEMVLALVNADVDGALLQTAGARAQSGNSEEEGK